MAEPGYGLTVTSLRRLRKLLWRYERKPDKIAPAVRIPASFSDVFPHRLAKPASGQSFNGATPTVSTTCDIYAGEPGSEVVVQEGVPVYQGRQLQSSETIGDTEWVIVGEVNSRLQLVSPRTTGGGGSGPDVKLVKLTSALAATAGASATGDVYTGTVGSETDSGANATVYRTRLMQSPEEIPSGAYVYTVELNGLDQVFAVAIQVTFMTAFQVDGATQKLQYKTRTATVLTAGTESGWTDAHTGTVC